MRSPAVSVVVPLPDPAQMERRLAVVPGDAEPVVVTNEGALARRCRPDAVVVPPTRAGRGNAVACGFAAVTGEIVVIADDDPSPLLHALRTGADVARGTATHGPSGTADVVVTRLAALALRRHTDPGSRNVAFWADLLPMLGLPHPALPGAQWGDGEEIDTLLTCRLVRAGLRVADVPTGGAAHTGRHVLAALWREGRGPLRTAPRLHEAPLAVPWPRENSEGAARM